MIRKITAAALISVGALATGALVASPAQAATNVCTGVTACRIVASSDIDGDRKADQIGMVRTSKITITRVRTAKKTMSITTRDTAQWVHEPLYGIAAIDGQAGNEIVVGSTTGANTYWTQVVTYRNGRLLTLKPPRPEEFTPKDGWAVQDSYNFAFGYKRSVSSRGVVSLVEQMAERRPAEGGDSYYQATDTTYRWKSGRWVRVSTKKSDVSEDKGRLIAGWHVKGLRRYPPDTWPRFYKNCRELNKDYHHGAARFDAKDKTSGRPVTNFVVRTFAYYMNDGPRRGSEFDLDYDNDGIVCEKR